MKLSDAIEQGAKRIRIRHRRAYLSHGNDKPCGCALGAAALGYIDDFQQAYNLVNRPGHARDHIGRLIAVQTGLTEYEAIDLARQIEGRFEGYTHTTQWSIKKIVAWLRRKGL